MAFKKLTEYVEEKNGVFFTLPNDNDFADVIFLYQSTDDVLVADVHYISSKGFSGYAHCLGDNCPACNYPTKTGKGIRRQSEIFIPLFNITKNKVEFWDRTTRFEQVLHDSVFKNYPNPSEYVFRITRHGLPRDPATRYEVRAISRNANYPYEQILKDFNLTMPDSYDMACKEMTYEEMNNYLNSDAPSTLPDYGYIPAPRSSSSASAESTADFTTVTVDTPAYSAPPTELPPLPEAIPFGSTENAVVSGATGNNEDGDGGSSDVSGDDIDNVDF